MTGTASEALCPCCGAMKPVYDSRFCRHGDNFSGECPASGKTPAEANDWVRKELADATRKRRQPQEVTILGQHDATATPWIPLGILQKEGGDDPVSAQRPNRAGVPVATGGPAEQGEAERAGGELMSRVDEGGLMTQIIGEDGSGIGTETVTEAAGQVSQGAVDALTGAKRTRKPRSDRAQYMVLAAIPAPQTYLDWEAARAEAKARAQNAEGTAYVVYQVRALRRFETGVQETTLGHMRKGRA